MTTQVSTHIDERTKQQFESVCEQIGISPSSAINIFIKGVINFNGIPFSVVVPADDPKIQNNPNNILPVSQSTPEEKRAALEMVRSQMAAFQDEKINLKDIQEERRASKYECND